MTIFSTLYGKILSWAQHKHAPAWLTIISFFESFVLPYPPPDILLAPMSIQRPSKAYYFAFICTVASVFGALAGYIIGAYFFELILPTLHEWGYEPLLAQVKLWFETYSVWIILVGGFSPIPFKLFTVSAGALSIALLPFLLTAFVARAARYYLVAYLMRKVGYRANAWLKKYIDRLGYFLIVGALISIWYAS